MNKLYVIKQSINLALMLFCLVMAYIRIEQADLPSAMMSLFFANLVYTNLATEKKE